MITQERRPVCCPGVWSLQWPDWRWSVEAEAWPGLIVQRGHRISQRLLTGIGKCPAIGINEIQDQQIPIRMQDCRHRDRTCGAKPFQHEGLVTQCCFRQVPGGRMRRLSPGAHILDDEILSVPRGDAADIGDITTRQRAALRKGMAKDGLNPSAQVRSHALSVRRATQPRHPASIRSREYSYSASPP